MRSRSQWHITVLSRPKWSEIGPLLLLTHTDIRTTLKQNSSLDGYSLAIHKNVDFMMLAELSRNSSRCVRALTSAVKCLEKSQREQSQNMKPYFHRRNQDFVWGALFFPFLVSDLKTQAEMPKQPLPSPLPNFLKNWTFALPRGCTLCLGCTYKFPL